MATDPATVAAELSRLIEKASASGDTELQGMAKEAQQRLDQLLERYRLTIESLSDAQKAETDKLERHAHERVAV